MEPSGITTEALPPRSSAAKLVSAPSPFNRPPKAASATSGSGTCQCKGSTAAITAACPKNASENHRNERSNEMWLVDSFWVTPVMPQKASATVLRISHVCISGAQQIDCDQCHREPRHLCPGEFLFQNEVRGQHGHQRKQAGERDHDGDLAAPVQREVKRDVPGAAEDSRHQREPRTLTPVRALIHAPGKQHRGHHREQTQWKQYLVH